jgi:hypothetical protein
MKGKLEVILFVFAFLVTTLLLSGMAAVPPKPELDALEAVYTGHGNRFPSSPVVGDIDGDGHPEIIFSSSDIGVAGNPYWPNDGMLSVIRKYKDNTIQTVWSLPFPSPVYAPAIADIDKDGKGEIVAFGADGTVYAINHDGTELWHTETKAAFSFMYLSDQDPAINDVNLDGYPDIAIYAGRQDRPIGGTTHYQNGMGWLYVFSGKDGKILWSVCNSGASSYSDNSQVSILDILGPDGDLDNLDNIPEVIASTADPLGIRVYSNTGTLRWGNVGGTNFAVVDLEKDGLPEIVTTSPTPWEPSITPTLYVYDNKGNIKYSDNLLSHGSGPAVADFDKDGYPEIAIVNYRNGSQGREDQVRLYDFYDYSQGKIPSPIRWETEIPGYGEFDYPDLTATDFNDDGSPEITVASDMVAAVVLNGIDGSILWDSHIDISESEHSPVIADVDKDGHSEIVLASGSDWPNFGNPTYPRALLILGNDDTWTGCRSVWNQMGYYASNINDDLTVPNDYHPWTKWNTWRAQLPQFMQDEDEDEDEDKD